MARHDTTLAKVLSKPPIANVKWHELSSLLKHLGFEEISGKGSRVKFYDRNKDVLIVCHRPHPSPDVDKGCLVDIANNLRSNGYIK